MKNIVYSSLIDCILDCIRFSKLSLVGKTFYRLEVNFLEPRPNLTHFLFYYSQSLGALEFLADTIDIVVSNYVLPRRARFTFCQLLDVSLRPKADVASLTSADVIFSETVLKSTCSGLLYSLEVPNGLT